MVIRTLWGEKRIRNPTVADGFIEPNKTVVK